MRVSQDVQSIDLNQQRGIRPGQYDELQQQLIERQRELYQNQMSLQWSNNPETSNPCDEIELPNVTVTRRVTKLNTKLTTLLNK